VPTDKKKSSKQAKIDAILQSLDGDEDE